MSHSSDEAAYLRLGNAWRDVHRVERTMTWPKVLIGIATFLLLSPVIGMVLVFAVLPALPLALLVGSVLGPMNLFPNGEREEEDENYAFWEARRHHHAEAHAH
jgi:hypothetical protein